MLLCCYAAAAMDSVLFAGLVFAMLILEKHGSISQLCRLDACVLEEDPMQGQEGCVVREIGNMAREPFWASYNPYSNWETLGKLFC